MSNHNSKMQPKELKIPTTSLTTGMAVGRNAPVIRGSRGFPVVVRGNPEKFISRL